MMNDEQMKQLLARASAGDASAMEALLVAHRSRLLEYISRHLPEDVRRVMGPEDVLQDVYFEAFRRLGTFTADGDSALDRWLATIARNKLIDLVRGHRAAKRGGGATADVGQGGEHSIEVMLQDLAVYERTPSKSVLAHELIAAMQTALGRLAEDHREALRLRYMEQLSPADVAARMGRTERAVHMLCNRGLHALREHLRQMSFHV
jgi:RNA polymerase sigma-70 factor, ECF subfamily